MNVKTILAGVGGLALAVGLVSAGAAGASPTVPTVNPSYGCSNGIWKGFCGTQTDIGHPALALAGVINPVEYKDPEDQVVGSNYVLHNRSRYLDQTSPDFIWFPYDGGPTKVAVFAPNGVPEISSINYNASKSNTLALTQRGSRLVLAPSTGALDQQWIAVQVTGGYNLKNAETGDLISMSGRTLHGTVTLVKMVAPPVGGGGSDNPTESFNFAG